MGMLLSELADYFGETERVSSSTGLVKALKRIGDFLITFSLILWVLFFGLLAVLINGIGR
jgi:hypothetical protein